MTLQTDWPIRDSLLRLATGFLLLIPATATLAQSPNDPTGFPFLTIGGGARAVGLAETMVADGADPFVTEYNPAALVDVDRFSVSLTHSEFFIDTRGEYAAAAVPHHGWGFGARLAYLGTSDIPRRTDVASEDPLGLYTAASGVFQGAIARRVDERLAVGLSGAWVVQHIDIESATGFILGIGLRYRLHPSLTFGTAFVNVGPSVHFISRDFKMPNLLRFGGKWTYNRLSVRAELAAADNDNVKWHLGGEYTPDPRLSLRSGIKLGYDTQWVSAGIGVRVPDGRVGVDYAFAPYTDELGATHRFGLTVRP